MPPSVVPFHAVPWIELSGKVIEAPLPLAIEILGPVDASEITQRH